MTVMVLVDDDNLRDRLAPGKFVRVMLIGPDEDHRPFRRRDHRCEVVAVVQVCRYAQVEGVDHPVEGCRRARAAEDHGMLMARAERLANDLPRLLSKSGRLEAGAGRIGGGVGVEGWNDLGAGGLE